MWNLIDRCWTAVPRERPTANEVVKQLRMRPSLDVDQRPHDNWDLSFGHRLRTTLLDNPFLGVGPQNERLSVLSHESEEDSTSHSPFMFNVADETGKCSDNVVVVRLLIYFILRLQKL